MADLEGADADYIGSYPSSIMDSLLHSVPFEVRVSSLPGFRNRLYIDLDFLHGYYDSNGNFVTAYKNESYYPDVDPSNTMQWGGFGYNGKDKHRHIKQNQSMDNNIRFDTLLTRMADMNLNSLRIEAVWNEIVPNITNISNNLHPDQVTSDSIAAYRSLIESAGGFSEISSRIRRALDRGIRPIVIVGCGHSDRPPKFAATDSIIAPGTVRGFNPKEDNYFKGVPPNVYLYYLKLYTGAVVSRFADTVVVWQAENELNAANFTESFDWWRKGNAWERSSFLDSVAFILYDVITTEDQVDAEVIQAFHLFNAAKYIKKWVNHYTICGLHLYPNQTIAYPIVGFLTGEYIWAARRILKHIGRGDRAVYLLETGYAAKTNEEAPDSFEDTAGFFNEQRQKEYLLEALNSCAYNGAKGFHWFLMASSENEEGTSIPLEKNNEFLGLFTENDEKKEAYFSYKNAFDSIGVEAVTFTNKYETENIGGSLKVQGVASNILSGMYMRISPNDTFRVSTNYQKLKRSNDDLVKHHHWNSNENDYTIMKSFISEDNNYLQDAMFIHNYKVDFYVNLNGSNDTSLVKQLLIRDPWYINGEGEQINEFYSLETLRDSTETDYGIFRNHAPESNNYSVPYYSVSAPYVLQKDGKLFVFDQWEATGTTLYSDWREPDEPNQKAMEFTTTSPTLTAKYWSNITLDIGSMIYYGEGVVKIKAPQFLADEEAIYKFKNWTTSTPSAVNFGSPNQVWSTVTFSGHNAEISAEYENCFDEELDIVLEEPLIIPPGAAYEIPADVAFIVDWGGNLLIEGTREKPVRIKGGTLLPKSASIATTLWDGILIKGGKVSIKNTLLSNADVAVKVAWVHKEGPFVKSGPIEIFNCSFVNNTRGIEWHDYPSHAQQENAILDARNNIFYGNDYGIWYDHNPRTTIRKSKIAYNDFYNNTHDIYEIDAPPPGSQTNHLEKYNNIFTNPLFLDATNENYNLSWGSPCIDAGDPEILMDPDQTNPDLGAHYHVQLEGTLTYDLSVGGEVRIEQNLTIPDSVTLTFLPGATVKLEDDVKIDVYGKLLAVGAENDSITFTSVYSSPATLKFWDRIKFNDSANDSSRFEYCRFKYGAYGIYAYKANITVLNCAIDSMYYYGIYVFNGIGDIRNNIITNCRYGIYIHSGNDYGISTLYDNILNEGAFSTSTYGIYLYKSSPELKNNEVNNFKFGITCSFNASPKLGWLGQQGYNYVHNCDRGLNTSYSSNPFLGQDMCNIAGGHNYFVNNNYHVYAGNTCNIMAENNWWGSSPPNSSKFYADNSYIDYNPYLTSGPLTKPAFLAKVSGEESSFDDAFGSFADSSLSEDEVMASFDLSWPLLNQLIFARNLIELGFPQAASVIANNILKVYPDSSEAYFALDLLWQAGRGYTPQFEQYKVYLDSLSKITYKAEVYEEAELLLDEYQSSGDLSKLAGSYKKYKSDRVASRALFNVFIYYLHVREDIAAATQILTILESEFPQSVAAAEARMLLGSMSDYDQSAAVIIPQTFELLGNYPNPFNPETHIRFALPISAQVEIIIVNLLGQKIKTIRSESLAAGIHELTWDSNNENGIRMSTGMYLYTFKAESTDRKETFQKNGKLLLLK